MNAKAAIYCRSSKDRSDVSIDAQRHELEKLARDRGLNITATFEDAVYSGSTDDRPGFQQLIGEIKNRHRGWSTVLVYDTSRLARGRFIAQAFRRECKRHGVELVIARLPETDPVSTVILESVFEAMDEVHSIMSRDKGLAGMRQNIAKGWRAGGRAPVGYRLVHSPTGAVRDGKPVMKSKLALADEADQIREYLRARAAREPRSAAVQRLRLPWSATTLIDVEWNALVYAGHTVWNRHREKKTRGDGKPKRRPRSEWVIQPNTHPALITDLEAESIIAQLEGSTIAEALRNSRAHTSGYMLSGLLFSSDGRPWVGAGKRYRLRPADGKPGKYVGREAIEAAVIGQVRQDSQDEAFIQRLTKATREWYPETDPGKDMDKEAQRLEKEAERAAKLALETSEPAPFISLMETKRRQAEAARRQAEAVRRDNEITRLARTVSAQTVRDAISADQGDAALIRGLVHRVVLEPTLECTVEYLPALGRSLKMASPRRSVAQTTVVLGPFPNGRAVQLARDEQPETLVGPDPGRSDPPPPLRRRVSSL